MVRATQLKEQAEGGEHQGQEVRELGCCSLSWRSGAKAGSQKPVRTSFCWHCLAAGA